MSLSAEIMYEQFLDREQARIDEESRQEQEFKLEWLGFLQEEEQAFWQAVQTGVIKCQN